MSDNAISISGLRVTLGDRAVLEGVDFNVQVGESVGIMGLSGSGKSTLLRAAVGLIEPEAGEVTLDGINITTAPASSISDVRKRVGMLFQAGALFDSMTVADNIGFSLREVMGERPDAVAARVDELLERLRLGPIGKKYPAELSGGMKKRVGIARAIAHDPDIVLYDDPTAGLDPITSDVIADLIAELAQKPGRTTLVASNYLPLVGKVASRLVLVEKGRIVELGHPDDLWSSDHTAVRELLDYTGGDAP